MAALCLVSPSFAQAPPETMRLAEAALASPERPVFSANPASSLTVRFEAASFEGNSLLPAPLLATLAAPYRGRELQVAELKALANSLSAAYQSEGYYLARASLPPQRIEDGTLRVALSEGRIVRIDAEGSGAKAARAAYAGVISGAPAHSRDLDAATQIARRLPGLIIDEVRPARLAEDDYALEIDARLKRFGGRLFATNKGSRRGEAWKTYLGLQANSLLAPGDGLSAGFMTKPAAPSELSYGVLRYDAAPARGGVRPFVAVTASDTAPISAFPDRDLDGAMTKVTGGVRVPLRLRRDDVLYWRASVEASRVAEAEDGETLYEDSLRAVRGGLTYEGASRRGSARAELTVSVGDTGSAGQSSRPDAEGAFVSLRGTAVARRKLGPARVDVAATFQLADDALVYQEEFAVGGGDFGRAYDFGEVLGEDGVAAYAEVGLPIVRGRGKVGVEPYLFADAGAAWNDGTKLMSDGKVLASAGVGINLTFGGNVSLSYEVAAPLTDAPYTEDDDHARHRIELTLLR